MNNMHLVCSAIGSMALIVVLISWLKLHPFLTLAVGSLAMGFGAGLGGAATVEAFTKGFGTTLGDVGVLIGFGAIFGRILADSGGADVIVDALLARSGARLLPWTMGLIGAIIGLPLFSEVGLVLLIPVILLVARRAEVPVMRVAVPTLAGLSTMHCLVPPHPGPLAAIAALHASLPATLALGVLAAIPVAMVSGPVFSSLAARWAPVGSPESFVPRETAARGRPGAGRTFAVILAPVTLMVCRSVAELVAPRSASPLHAALMLLGTPLVALGVGVFVAAATLGLSRPAVTASMNNALGPVAGVILMIGSGGGFKQVLVDAGISGVIGKAADSSHLPLLVLGWLVAALIRVSTGSATVATVAASGILAPLAAGLPATHTALLVLAIGSGSVFFSHVNDAGFWMVKGYFELDMRQTFMTWTALQSIIALVGLACVLLLGAALL